MAIIVLTHLIAWLIVLSTVQSLMVTWFRTETFPGLVFKVVRACGWHRHDPDFWPPEEELEPLWLRNEWEQWADFQLGMLGGLLRCPICLSWHLTFWTTIIVWCVALFVSPLHIVFVPVTLVTTIGVTYGIFKRL